MDEDLNDKLRKALRAVDPDKDFAGDVLARIDALDRRPSRKPLGQRTRRWQIPVALAASVAAAIAVGFHWKQQQQGLRARAQLIEALHVTSAKLDLVHQIVQERTRPDDGQENGA